MAGSRRQNWLVGMVDGYVWDDFSMDLICERQSISKHTVILFRYEQLLVY